MTSSGRSLQKRAVKNPPADDVPADVRRRAQFVKPELVAEIAFRGFTDEGYVRQGSYKGLRKDKPAKEIVAERPPDPPAGEPSRAARHGAKQGGTPCRSRLP